MAFVVPKETYSGKIYEVTLGKGDKAVTVGGESTLPFLTFEGEVPNRPAVAYEIQDIAPDDWPETVASVYKGVSSDPAAWAKFCQDQLGAKIIALRLIGTHPDRSDLSPEVAAKTVANVLSAINVPLIIFGSNHIEKDGPVLKAAAEAAKDSGAVIGKAQQENYKTIVAAAAANNLRLVCMSQLDVNLAKQLNILTTQMGFDKEKILTDPMSSALGYGIEYTYSVMERIRLAALQTNDPMMQTPMIGDIGANVWKAKEAAAEIAEWGAVAPRGIAWEATTGVGMLMAGAELLVMRHPEAVAVVENTIDELMR